MYKENGPCGPREVSVWILLKVYCKFTYTCSHCTLEKHHMQSTSTQDHYMKELICKHLLLLLVLSCIKTVLYSGELEEYS